MAILEIDEARERYPHYLADHCEDPRCRDGDDNEAVAVIETRYDLYAVCEACLARIVEAETQ